MIRRYRCLILARSPKSFGVLPLTAKEGQGYHRGVLMPCCACVRVAGRIDVLLVCHHPAARALQHAGRRMAPQGRSVSPTNGSTDACGGGQVTTQPTATFAQRERTSVGQAKIRASDKAPLYRALMEEVGPDPCPWLGSAVAGTCRASPRCWGRARTTTTRTQSSHHSSRASPSPTATTPTTPTRQHRYRR
jgi:hypothetical protein